MEATVHTEQPGPQQLQWFVAKDVAEAAAALEELKHQMKTETPQHLSFQ